MLKLEVTRYTSTGFACFRRYFDSVNINEQKLRITAYGPQPVEVEKQDLIGFDYIWKMSLNSANEQIAKEAIELLIALNFTYLSAQHKAKDSASLRKIFLSNAI